MITYITRTTGSKWKSRLTLGIFATSFSFLKQQGASNKPNQEIYSTTKKPKKKKKIWRVPSQESFHTYHCVWIWEPDLVHEIGVLLTSTTNPTFHIVQTRIRMKTANMGLKPPIKPMKTTRAKCVSWKLDTTQTKNTHTNTSIHIRNERKSFESPGREDAFSKNNTPKRGRAGPSGCQMRNSKSDSWETILILLTTCKCGDERRGLANQADAHTNGCPQQLWKKNLSCARAHTKRGRGRRKREKLEAEAAEEAKRMDEKNCRRTELGHGWNCIYQDPTAMIKASYSLFSRLDT